MAQLGTLGTRRISLNIFRGALGDIPIILGALLLPFKYIEVLASSLL